MWNVTGKQPNNRKWVHRDQIMVKMDLMEQGPYRSHPETVTHWEKDPEAFFCWSLWLVLIVIGSPAFIWAGSLVLQPLAMFPAFAMILLAIWIRDGVIKAPFRRVRKFR